MLKSIELVGFKSFGRKTELVFTSPIAAIVGPNGSGKSNVAEGFRFVLGEQSMKSLRSKRGEDLIWGGSSMMPRANRAAVKVVFDNSDRILDLDFEEVIIERVVYRDGTNEYLINGSKVRLRDVIRMLAGANIGGSGYHIISQGAADHILVASPKERREMIEEALGLKLYQHKKIESEKKLDEMHENVERVQSLRREITPHLKFLRVQVEKIEKARELREELAEKLAEYLARERAWIDAETTRLGEESHDLKNQLQIVLLDVEKAKTILAKSRGEKKEVQEDPAIGKLEQELAAARERREAKTRELGRAEGVLHAAREAAAKTVSISTVEQFVAEVEEGIGQAQAEETPQRMRDVLIRMLERVRRFRAEVGGGADEEATSGAQQELEKLTQECESIQKEEVALAEQLKQARAHARTMREEEHAIERELLKLESREREVRAQLETVSRDKRILDEKRQAFEEEMSEGIVLIGSAVHQWEKQNIPDGALSENRQEQERRRRDIERLKIKIEEYGAGNADEILREFKQTQERDEFLARELADLEKSAASLVTIIEELEAKIDEEFKVGLGKINEALQMFFGQLFGGGVARLDLERSRAKKVLGEDDGELVEEEVEPGLSIHVQLPRKKIRGLEVLSGGERALTSIAMIFAMSQVNPPPFLILDETDAALDEANSKRYADMVQLLSKRSQLVLITHNRATMAAAGELYGVTMGADGVSKLLSVKLDEAERVAK